MEGMKQQWSQSR